METELLDRVRKLLAKAEDEGCTPHEAEALTAKAAELMARYGIDRALLGALRPETDRPSDRVFDLDNPWADVKAHLLAGLATALRCQCILQNRREPGSRVHVFGYLSDLERADILFTSLLVQMARALAMQPVPGLRRRGEGVAAVVDARLLFGGGRAGPRGRGGGGDGGRDRRRGRAGRGGRRPRWCSPTASLTVRRHAEQAYPRTRRDARHLLGQRLRRRLPRRAEGRHRRGEGKVPLRRRSLPLTPSGRRPGGRRPRQAAVYWFPRKSGREDRVAADGRAACPRVNVRIMEHVRLGRSGLQVSRLCLGTMTFGLQSDEATAIAVMDRAAEGGVDFLDSSDAYPLGGDLASRGRTEEIIGRWLRGKRDRFIIATKCFAPVGPAPFDAGNSRKHIMSAVEDSLRRLQTDYIDLYQLHGYDPNTPIDETLGALDDLVHQGKVRYTGCSNFLTYQLVRAIGRSETLRLARFDSVQPRYNLLFRQIEREMLPFCAEDGVGVISYNPIAGGLLSGKHSRTAPPPEGSRFTLG